METITKMVFKGASEETGFDATKGISMDQVTQYLTNNWTAVVGIMNSRPPMPMSMGGPGGHSGPIVNSNPHA